MADQVELTAEHSISDVLGEIENDDIVAYVGGDDLLEEIGMNDAIEYFKTGNILDEIGKDEVMIHFGLVEPGEE